MRRLIVLLLLLLPLFCSNFCGEECNNEFEEDLRNHECRTCTMPSIDSKSECAEFGYECDDNSSLKTNILSSSTCECSTVRCADRMQRMFVKGKAVNRVFCNNREWTTISGNSTEAVACGKSCDIGVCTTSHPLKPLDYSHMHVSRANKDTKCATGTCTDGSLVALNKDGTVESPLDGPSVTCTGDKKWMDKHGISHQYVMCEKCNCPEITSTASCWSGGYCVGLVKNGCSYSCPEDSHLFYWETADEKFYKPWSPNPVITCKGGKFEGFPDPVPHDNRAYCSYPTNSKYLLTSLPEEDSTCKSLVDFDEAGSEITADFGNIVYVKDGGDYYATCRQGIIIFPGRTHLSPLKIRCVGGSWEGGVVKVTCGLAEGQLMPSCLENGNPPSDFILRCFAGTCTIECHDSLDIEYKDKEGTPEQTPYLGCVNGKATRLSGEQISNSELSCVL